MNHNSDNQLKKTVKDSFIYAIGTLLRQITAFVMLPIYTLYLTPADYGTVSLLTMVIEIAGILIGLRITQAMFRYYMMSDDEAEQKKIVSTVIFSVLIATSLGVALIAQFSKPLSQVIFGTAQYNYELTLFGFTLMTNAIATVGWGYIRARQMPIFFVTLGAISLVLQVISNIIFVVVLEMHVLGVVYGSLLSSSILAIFMLYYLLKNAGFHYSWTIANKLYRFIAPLILASLGSFYAFYADKYLLRIFTDLDQVGIYSLALKIAGIVGLVSSAFELSWEADRFKIYKKENAGEIFPQIFRFYTTSLILVAAGIIIFTDDLIRLMTTPGFYPASDIIPVAVISVLILSLTMFCNFGIHLREKTRHIAEAQWIKACAMTIGCFAMIPFIGIFGAIISVVISNLMAFFWIYFKAKSLYDLKLQWKHFYSLILLCATTLIVCAFIPDDRYIYMIPKLMAFLVLIALTYWLPKWSPNDRELMHDSYKKVKSLLIRK